jgi:L-ectoine synthase
MVRCSDNNADVEGDNAMIVRTLDGILGTNRDVRGPGWQSRRLILAADAMGCSVSDTIVAAGTEQRLQ